MSEYTLLLIADTAYQAEVKARDLRSHMTEAGLAVKGPLSERNQFRDGQRWYVRQLRITGDWSREQCSAFIHQLEFAPGSIRIEISS